MFTLSSESASPLPSALPVNSPHSPSFRSPLHEDWRFVRLPDGTSPAEASRAALTAMLGAEEVELPHSPFTADLDGRHHWQGFCVYRRALQLVDGAERLATGTRTCLWVGAAMHTADVWLDDQHLARHEGGYLPFEVDLSKALADGKPHRLTLLLDNRDCPDVPPGKPLADLDFCWYGGLYRGAELRVYPPVHITDPITANVPAGGGLFLRTLAATREKARVSAQVHIGNNASTERQVAAEFDFRLRGQSVARERTALQLLPAGTFATLTQEIPLTSPALWHPNTPQLYDVFVTLVDENGQCLDQRSLRFGVRRLHFSRSRGLEINGERFRPRGTNRHQEYPIAGYAVPPAAQKRDARRIKEAGFDYVRLSHYPQDTAFLEACDELGILVMNAIPGWQFFGGEVFQRACYRNAREMIRRDRNHACVILWELSLNETEMDELFMTELHRIGHQEYPGDQMFTCGWIDRFDVFTHSRQHGQIHTWKNGDKALAIAEYGDWEFFASNHGFDQKTGAGLFAPGTHGRQLRAAGERGLLQQAFNHTLALNDTLASSAVLDGQWCAFDYARGYDPNRAACGVADIFRLPKFSWYFYRSQRHTHEGLGGSWHGGPVVFIASHWIPASNLSITVFSNAEEVELRLNGQVVGRTKPTFSWMTQFLPHPPFHFVLDRFIPGELEAIAYSGGKPIATHKVSTPGALASLVVRIDTLDTDPNPGEGDLLIAHAELRDTAGHLCVQESQTVIFTVSSDSGCEVLGPTRVDAEAGIASTVIRVRSKAQGFELKASLTESSQAAAASASWTRGGASANSVAGPSDSTS